MLLSALFPLLAAAAFAASPQFVGQAPALSELPREEFVFLGWSDTCSAALTHMRFPKLGEGLHGEPVEWRIGSLTLAPGQTRPKSAWRYDSRRDGSWIRDRARQETEALTKTHMRKGFLERVRDADVPDRADLTALLLTTAALRTDGKPAWPEAGSVPYRIHYHPLLQCALVVFRERLPDAEASYQAVLVRLLDPGVRRERAHAHATYGILLYTKNADLAGAEGELATAVELDPRRSDARYHLALLLASQAKDVDALEQLRAAVLLEPELASSARKAIEFETLRTDPRFLDIVEKPLR